MDKNKVLKISFFHNLLRSYKIKRQKFAGARSAGCFAVCVMVFYFLLLTWLFCLLSCYEHQQRKGFKNIRGLKIVNPHRLQNKLPLFYRIPNIEYRFTPSPQSHIYRPLAPVLLSIFQWPRLEFLSVRPWNYPEWSKVNFQTASI